jgi:hypothetical protein
VKEDATESCNGFLNAPVLEVAPKPRNASPLGGSGLPPFWGDWLRVENNCHAIPTPTPCFAKKSL